MHARTGGFQDRPQERGRRTLAVGPGNMDDGRQTLVRLAELGEEAFDAPERQVDQLGMQEFQLRQELSACCLFPHGRSALVCLKAAFWDKRTKLSPTSTRVADR